MVSYGATKLDDADEIPVKSLIRLESKDLDNKEFHEFFFLHDESFRNGRTVVTCS